MKSLFYIFALIAGISAAPIGCLPQTIQLNGTWYQPQFPVSPNSYCDSTFLIPAGFYANLKISVSGLATDDLVVIHDRFQSTFSFQYDERNPSQSAKINFNTNFEILIYTGRTTTVLMEVTVTLKKITAIADNTVTTKANGQPTVIYIKNWAVGTSYTFTSNSSSSKVAVLVDPAFAYNNIDEEARLNNIFVSERGVNKGSLCLGNMYLSASNQVTLNIAEQTFLKGAILVTDYDNIKNFAKFNVQYVPVNEAERIAYAPLDGSYNKAPYAGAVSIIGDENGSTPITIHKLDNFNNGGQFTYMYGGPVANYEGNASPINNSNLPRTLSGNLVTFILSKDHGNVKYTI